MSKVLDRILSPGLRKILLKIVRFQPLSSYLAGLLGQQEKPALCSSWPAQGHPAASGRGGAPTTQPRSAPQVPKLTQSLTPRFQSPRLSQGRSSFFSSMVLEASAARSPGSLLEMQGLRLWTELDQNPQPNHLRR